MLALTVVDRESMLWALDEPPTDALAELRGVLLRGARVSGARGTRVVALGTVNAEVAQNRRTAAAE